MNPLIELQRIFTPGERTFAGLVVSIDGDAVVIQSATGRARASRPAGLALSVGDEVLVRDGAVQGRLRAAEFLPVYRL